MSNVRGRIAVDVLFTDSTASSDEQSLKTVTMQDATEYVTGKVAIVSGTCGPEVVSAVANGVTTYKDSTGDAVTFATITRCAVQCTGSSVIVYDNTSQLICNDGVVSVFQPTTTTITCNTFSGTAAFTLVLYGT